MCLKAISAVWTLDHLYPKEMEDRSLDTPGINASVQRTEGGTDTLLKLLKGRPEIWEVRHLQLKSCHYTCYRIHIDTDDLCTEAARFHDGCPATYERIEYRVTTKVGGAVVRTPEVVVGISGTAHEKCTDDTPQAPSKPLVCRIYGARPTPLTSGQLRELSRRKLSQLEQRRLRQGTTTFRQRIMSVDSIRSSSGYRWWHGSSPEDLAKSAIRSLCRRVDNSLASLDPEVLTCEQNGLNKVRNRS